MTQLYICIFFLIVFFIVIYHRIQNIVPCANTVKPSCLSMCILQIASINPERPVLPAPGPLPTATASLFSVSVGLFLFHREVRWRHSISHVSDTKWPLSDLLSMIISMSSVLLQMALLHSFLWLSSMPLCVCVCVCVCVAVLSLTCAQLFATPWTAA